MLISARGQSTRVCVCVCNLSPADNQEKRRRAAGRDGSRRGRRWRQPAAAAVRRLEGRKKKPRSSAEIYESRRVDGNLKF